MSGLASTSSTNMLRRSRSYFELPPWIPEDQLELNFPEAIAELDDGSDMDLSPTSSRTSSISPTSSEHTLTPTTPTTSYSSFGILKASIAEKPRSDFDLPLVGFPRNPKTTIQYILASPAKADVLEEPSQTTVISLGLPRRRSSRKHSAVSSTICTAASQAADYEGDIAMLSPLNSPSTLVVQASTTTTTDLSLRRQRTGLGGEKPISNDGTSKAIPPWRAESNFYTMSLRSRRLQSRSLNSQCQSLSPPQLSHNEIHNKKPAFTQLRNHMLSPTWKAAPSHKPSTLTSLPQPTKLHVITPNANKTQLQNSINHLSIPLVPLVSVTTALPHPDFPRSLLQYNLLTHAQLDNLARWYHQTIENTLERYQYPEPMTRPWVWSDEKLHSRMRELECEVNGFVREVDLDNKRRRFGRFIGLRGCESPVKEVNDQRDTEREREEALEERMDREWRAALRRAEEEQRVLEKSWRGRW